MIITNREVRYNIFDKISKYNARENISNVFIPTVEIDYNPKQKEDNLLKLLVLSKKYIKIDTKILKNVADCNNVIISHIKNNKLDENTKSLLEKITECNKQIVSLLVDEKNEKYN